MTDAVTVGLVGCGGMMESHVEGLRKLWDKEMRNFRVTAVCDIDAGRAELMADKVAQWQGLHPSVYTDVEAMLAWEDDLDAVDISVVHRAHHDVAIQCIDAGKHVTIEKPLAMTLRAGKLIMAAVEGSGNVFQVAENYRRSPSERAINWAIKEGRIGDIRMIFWVDVGERLWHWGWRDDLSQAGGGWSMDGGVHFADLFRYHIGEVDEVYCVSKAYNPTRYANHEALEGPILATTEDTTMAVLKFANGVTGQWTSTSAAPGCKCNYRAIYGEHGCIKWDDGLYTRKETLAMQQLEDEYMKSLSEDKKERLFPRGITDTVATELKEFIDAIVYATPIEVTALEAYKDEAISLALYESSELCAPVKMADVESLEIELYQSRLNEELGLARVTH